MRLRDDGNTGETIALELEIDRNTMKGIDLIRLLTKHGRRGGLMKKL